LEPLAPDYVQKPFEYLQGGRTHHLHGQPVPVLSHPHRKKVSPGVHIEPPVFQFVPTASYSVAEHHWKETAAVFFTPFLQLFINIDEVCPERPLSG